MSQPTPYIPSTDFSQEEASGVAGRSTSRTAALDVEFDNVATTIGQVLANLSAIQRDDTKLQDLSVELHTLSAEVLALIGSAGFTISDPIGWLTATVYPARIMVKEGTGTYVSVVAHTSGVFATDLAAGKWVLIFDSSNYIASAVAFTPTGTIAATNVQAAIAEAALEAVQKAANGADFASIASTRSNLSVYSKDEIRTVSGLSAAAGGTADAITAAFTPAVTAWADNLLLIVEAAAANATATPTITPDAVAAKTIKKFNFQPLAPGDIAGAGHRLLLQYDATDDSVLLLNPATLYGSDVQGTDVVVAAALDLPDYGNFFNLTGTGTVSTIEARAAGFRATFSIGTSVTFNYDGTNLVLKDGATSTLSSGDVITFRSKGGGSWVEESRKNTPARQLVAAKLALAQLAR